MGIEHGSLYNHDEKNEGYDGQSLSEPHQPGLPRISAYSEVRAYGHKNAADTPITDRAADELYIARNTEIITSVLMEGLIPGSELKAAKKVSLLSGDDHDIKDGIISGRVLEHADEIDRILCAQDAFSVLPVLAERVGMNIHRMKYEPFEVIEERMHHSILIAAPTAAFPEEQRKAIDRPEAGFFIDRSVSGVVPPALFTRVFVPEPIYTALPESVLQEHPRIVQVGETEEPIFFGAAPYNVPDYRGGLESLLAEIPQRYFVHGVRLFTQEDMRKERT